MTVGTVGVLLHPCRVGRLIQLILRQMLIPYCFAAQSVTVSWDANSEPNVVDYNSVLLHSFGEFRDN
jgi:hypothetical protein